MKKKVILLLVVVLFMAGCGKVPKLKNGDDALVSFEKDSISVEDFYKKLKDTYGLSVMANMIDKYVVETKFSDYEDTARDMAKDYIDLISEDYESDEKLLEDIQNYTGYSTIKEYENAMYLNYMKTHATEEYIKENITDKEIQNYYDDEIKPDIEISHILITPDVNDDMTDEEIKEMENEALETANKIIKELKDTKKDNITSKFAELAKKYSKDETTNETGGSLGKINTDTLGSTYQDLVTAAYKLKDNEYTVKAIKTTLGYHIVLKTKTYDKAKLEDVKDTIIESIVDEKIASDSTASINAMQHYRNELGMEINDSTLNSEFNNYIQNSLSYALSQ